MSDTFCKSLIKTHITQNCYQAQGSRCDIKIHLSYTRASTRYFAGLDFLFSISYKNFEITISRSISQRLSVLSKFSFMISFCVISFWYHSVSRYFVPMSQNLAKIHLFCPRITSIVNFRIFARCPLFVNLSTASSSGLIGAKIYGIPGGPRYLPFHDTKSKIDIKKQSFLHGTFFH